MQDTSNLEGSQWQRNGLAQMFVMDSASMHSQSSAYLIETVGSPLREEGLNVGVTQQVILGHPVRQQNVVTKIQVAAVDSHQLQVLLCQLPHSPGWGYRR